MIQKWWNQNVYCGDPNAEIVDWKGATFPTFVDQNDPTYKTYRVGELQSGVVGEYYRLCWAHNVTNTTTNHSNHSVHNDGGTWNTDHAPNHPASDPQYFVDVTEYNVQIGLFTLKGLDPIDTIICTLGELCSITLTGVDL